MRKILLSLAVILSFLFYSFYQKFEGEDDDDSAVVPPKLSSIPTSTTPKPVSDPANTLSTPTPLNNTNPVSERTPAPVTATKVAFYKDGEYTGDVADAYYGNVQVQAVIKGGKITDVFFLDYPNDRRTSERINTQAMPYLRQEAIIAQSANVNIVTGATQTSKAFRESLKTALDKARV